MQQLAKACTLLSSACLQWPAVTTVARTPFRVHSTFHTCFTSQFTCCCCCLQCRKKVERVNKNHLVNNLVEAYLKSNPGELFNKLRVATWHFDLQTSVRDCWPWKPYKSLCTSVAIELSTGVWLYMIITLRFWRKQATFFLPGLRWTSLRPLRLHAEWKPSRIYEVMNTRAWFYTALCWVWF